MPVLNTWKRKALAVLAVALLGIPAALGVYKALAPTRGPWGAGLAAAGFELVYISTAILVLTPELRAYARRVALAAVATSVLLNTLADYAHRVPGGLASWAQAQRLFDPLAIGLSVVESLPLAGLAYAMAELLHRLAEAETRLPVNVSERARTRQSAPTPVWAALGSDTLDDLAPANIALDSDEAQAAHDELRGPLDEPPPAARDYTCKRCGMIGLTAAELMAHGRRFKRWGVCEPAPFVTPAAD